MLATYILHVLLFPILTRRAYWKNRASMKHPQKCQDDVLRKILNENGKTAFGKDYSLDNIKSSQEFRKKMPLTTYKHYEKYVDRIANGEENVMTKRKIVQLCASSGTTGKNKMYPLTLADESLFLDYALTIVYAFHYVLTYGLKREFYFHLYHPAMQTKSGITISGLAAYRQKRRKPNATSPLCLSKIGKEGASYFVQAVFALRDPDVAFIQGTSSDLMYAFWKSIEFNRAAICDAIASGHIKSFPDLDEQVRQELNEELLPDSVRAKLVEEEIKKGSDMLALRVWQHLKVSKCQASNTCRGVNLSWQVGG
jgi:hypothetical protein